MKVKAQTIFDALPVITAIIDQRRPMPQAGKYRLARMHAKLLPEWKVLNDQRNELVKTHGAPKKIHKPIEVGETIPLLEGETAEEATKRRMGEMIDSDDFEVPAEKMPAFMADLEKVMVEEIDITVNAIPIGMLSPANADNGSVEAGEIALMGELIVDLTEVTD